MAAANSSDNEDISTRHYEVQEILNYDRKPPIKLVGTNIELEATIIFNAPFQQPISTPNDQKHNNKGKQQNPSYLRFRVLFNQNIEKIQEFNNWLTRNLRKLNARESCEEPVHLILNNGTGETDNHAVADDKSNQFLAVSPIDGRYGRAKVLSYTSQACNRVRVLLIDTGHAVYVPVRSLRQVFSSDFDFEPLSFDAILANVNDYNMSNGHKTVIDYEFRRICQNYMSPGKQLLVKIFRYNKHLKAFEIYINVIQNGKRICLNDLIQIQYDNIHKLLHGKNRAAAAGITRDGEDEISRIPTTTDIAKQTYSDVETHIWKPPADLGKTMQIYQITHIVSPTHFYFVPISTSDSGVENNTRVVPFWYQSMQTFYNDEDYSHAFKKRTDRVFPGRCYIWKFCNLWERVRVTNANPKGSTCTVFLVDIGLFLSAPKNELYEIDTIFVGESVIALLGKLQHIEPIGKHTHINFDPDDDEDDEKSSTIWPEEAVEYMKKLVYGKYFYGIFVSDTQLPVFRNLTKEQTDARKYYFIEKKKAELERHLKKLQISASSKRSANEVEAEISTMKFGMVFVEITQKSRVTVNAELCLANLASACGPAAGSTFQFIINGVSVPKFDYKEMRAASLKYDRDEFIDPKENPEFSKDFQPFEVESEQLQSLPDITTRADFLTWMNLNPPLNESSDRVPTIIRYQLALCKITCVLSPSCMYIQLFAKRKEFTMMTKNLEMQMVKRKQIPARQLNVGLMVGVLISNSKDKKIEPTWHRAVVKQILSSLGLVKLILLDFGNEYTSEDNKLFPIPKYFASISSFCIRVHLDPPNLAPKNTVTWSQRATTTFKCYITSWTHQQPIYFFWKRHSSRLIRLDVLNQELFFDIGTRTWNKIPLEKKTGYPTAEVSKKMHLIPQEPIDNNLEGYEFDLTDDENPSTTSCPEIPDTAELTYLYRRRKRTTSLRTTSPSPERRPSVWPSPYGDTPPIISQNYEFEAPFSCKILEKCPAMANYFLSIGIDFGYEIFTSGAIGANYKFGLGYDALADGGDVIPLY